MREVIIPNIQIGVQLSIFRGSMRKEMDKLIYKYDSAFTKEDSAHPESKTILVSLEGSTSDKRICSWSPSTLAHFIEQWKIKAQLKLRILYVEALPASCLRRVVMSIRDFIQQNINTPPLYSERSYYSTINPESKGWEIKTFLATNRKSSYVALHLN